MKVVIPKKMKRKVNPKINKYYHYELIKVYPHHVIYKCEETGKLESFSKNEFIREVENEQ